MTIALPFRITNFALFFRAKPVCSKRKLRKVEQKVEQSEALFTIFLPKKNVLCYCY